jgi:hypothetical protein
MINGVHMRILLDMDGVVADCVRGLMDRHDKPWPFGGEHAGEQVWDFAYLWGMTMRELFYGCGYDFWRWLPKTSEADRIVDIAVSFAGENNVCFLTHPISEAGCIDGKVDWCHANYPAIPVLGAFSSAAVYAPPKYFAAAHDAVLIDDYTSNVVTFCTYGGKAILFPRPWNYLHEAEPDACEVMRRRLERIAVELNERGFK